MSAQEDYDILSALAERFQLDEEESDNFVSSGMKRLGYKARQMWEDDENGGNSGGDFFSTRRRERRPATPPNRRRGGSSGGNWQYGQGA